MALKPLNGCNFLGFDHINIKMQDISRSLISYTFFTNLAWNYFKNHPWKEKFWLSSSVESGFKSEDLYFNDDDVCEQ